MSETKCECLASDRSHRYWFCSTVRPESGLIGWTLQVDFLDRPLRYGGYKNRLLAGAWDAPSEDTARATASAAIERHRHACVAAR